MAQLAFVGLVALIGLGFAAGIATGMDLERGGQVATVVVSTPAPAQKKNPGVKLEGDGRCNAPITASKGSKEGREGLEKNKDGLQALCVPGCVYKIYQVENITDVQGKDTCKGLTGAQKTTCEKSNACVVANCKGGTCVQVGGNQETKDKILGRESLVPEYYKNDPQLKDILETSKTNPAAAKQQLSQLPPHIQNAFSELSQDEQIKNNQQVAENLEKLKAIGNPADVEAQRLQAENEKLLKQNANLADARVLTPTTTPDPKKDPTVPPSRTPADPPRTPTSPDGTTFPSPTGSGSANPLSSLLSSLGKLLGGSGGLGGTGQACPTDQNAYAQYQQQYNTQLQQYNYALQQYNYQLQIAQMQGLPAPVAPTPPTPCTPSSNSGSGTSQCSTPPTVPTSACAAGWRPTYSGQCITGWQCGSATAPVAAISCQPELADIGMNVAISFGCQNAATSVGQGFSTAGALSGSTTTVVTAATSSSTVNFGLTCSTSGASDSKQCTVRINRPSIVLTANPKIVSSGATSTVGWVTAGIESCIVSSPNNGAFTAENADKPRASGTAETPILSETMNVSLACTTLAGGSRTATTTVTVQ